MIHGKPFLKLKYGAINLTRAFLGQMSSTKLLIPNLNVNFIKISYTIWKVIVMGVQILQVLIIGMAWLDG